MPTAKSKEIRIEYMQWHKRNSEWGAGVHREQEAQAIVAWVNTNGGEARYVPQHAVGRPDGIDRQPRIAVRTNSGWAPVAPDWYVMKGSEWFHVDGPVGEGCRDVRDFYPCDPETFTKRWEPLSELEQGEADFVEQYCVSDNEYEGKS